MNYRFLFGSRGWMGFALSALTVVIAQILLTVGTAHLICHSYEGDTTTYWLIPAVAIVSGLVFGAAMPAMGLIWPRKDGHLANPPAADLDCRS